MIPLDSRLRLLHALIAEAEQTTAENVERARWALPELKHRDHGDIFFDLRDRSDVRALRVRTVWLRRRGIR